jgi:hypothetical protein
LRNDVNEVGAIFSFFFTNFSSPLRKTSLVLATHKEQQGKRTGAESLRITKKKCLQQPKEESLQEEFCENSIDNKIKEQNGKKLFQIWKSFRKKRKQYLQFRKKKQLSKKKLNYMKQKSILGLNIPRTYYGSPIRKKSIFLKETLKRKEIKKLLKIKKK